MASVTGRTISRRVRRQRTTLSTRADANLEDLRTDSPLDVPAASAMTSAAPSKCTLSIYLRYKLQLLLGFPSTMLLSSSGFTRPRQCFPACHRSSLS